MQRDRLVVPTPPSRISSAVIADELGRLTPRDHQLLVWLDQHKVFTTEQIADLAFGSVNRARARLNILYGRSIVDRFRHYVRPGSQSWRWTLGPTGAAVVALAADRPPPRPVTVRESAARVATSPKLPHLLGTNGVFVALAREAREGDGRLLRWWNEATATRHTRGVVRPDGAGAWSENGRTVAWWLEYDTGTEQVHRLITKLDGYAQLAGTAAAYPVLFWLPSAIREANFHASLTNSGHARAVTVATTSGDDPAAVRDPAGPVWHLHGLPTKRRLVEIPTSPAVDCGPWAA